MLQCISTISDCLVPIKSHTMIACCYLAFVTLASWLVYGLVGAWPYVLGKPYLTSEQSRILYQKLQNPKKLERSIRHFAKQQPQSEKIQKILQAVLVSKKQMNP